ncbi:MAG: hypothetical protein AB1631_29805 [Acidobacteriota bacterium]
MIASGFFLLLHSALLIPSIYFVRHYSRVLIRPNVDLGGGRTTPFEVLVILESLLRLFKVFDIADITDDRIDHPPKVFTGRTTLFNDLIFAEESFIIVGPYALITAFNMLCDVIRVFFLFGDEDEANCLSYF